MNGYLPMQGFIFLFTKLMYQKKKEETALAQLPLTLIFVSPAEHLLTFDCSFIIFICIVTNAYAYSFNDSWVEINLFFGGNDIDTLECIRLPFQTNPFI